jgi:hypothetical protein
MMLTVSGGVSAYHSDNLSTEVQKGFQERFEHGRWIGLLSYGYQSVFDYDAKGERIKGSDRAVFSDDAETVRLIFTRYATELYSDTDLAEELNAAGRTMICKGQRVPFQKDSIGGILTNKFYLGIVTYHGEERPGNHEPLIDRALWESVQSIRQRRTHMRPASKRRAAGLSGGGRLGEPDSIGILSAMARCAHCGAVLYWHNGEDYWCSQRRKFGKSACDAPMILASRIDPLVLDVLRALTIPATVRDAVLAEVRRRLDHAVGPDGNQRSALEAQLERLKDLYQFGDLERGAYLQKRRLIERQLARLPNPSAQLLNTEHAIGLLSNMDALLDSATPAQHRALIRQVIETVWIEKVAVTAIKPAATYALLVELAAGGSLVTSAGVEPTTFSFGG